MYTLVTGNPIDGISLYGLFKTKADAQDAAEQHFRKSDWWVMEIRNL